MLAGNNDLNMLLKAQVVRIRAELDLKGSMPKIRQQVDTITKRLRNKPVKLNVDLDYKLSELFSQRTAIQNRLNKIPLKLSVMFDLDGTKGFRGQINEMSRVMDSFNEKARQQARQTGKVVQESVNIPASAHAKNYNNIKQYNNALADAERILRSKVPEGKGLFSTTQMKDAKGNLTSFVAQLERANGVVEKVRYEWDSKSAMFSPISRQTVDTIQKHSHQARQALMALEKDINSLNDGVSKTMLRGAYEGLERRNELSKDAVQNLKIEIDRERALQQQSSKTNAEYVQRQRLIKDINNAQKEAKRNDGGVDVKPYQELVKHVREGKKTIQEVRLELDKMKDAQKEQVRNEKEFLAQTKKRMQLRKELRQIELNTSKDNRAQQNLIKEIRLLTEGKMKTQEWLAVEQKMSVLRESKANTADLEKRLRLLDRVEKKIRDLGAVQNHTSKQVEKNMVDANNAFMKSYKDLDAYYHKINRQLDEIRAKNKSAVSGTELIGASPTNANQALLQRNIRGAVNSGDIQALQKYMGELYKGRVETVKLEQTTDSLGRAVDRMKVKMAGTGKTVRAYTVDLDRANNSLRQTAQGFDYNANRNLGVMEQLRIAMARVPVWMSAMTAFYGTIRTVQAFTREILEVDKALTELRRVASADLNIEQAFSGAVTMARELGNNVHDVMQTLNDFARTYGEFNERQLLAITNTATLMANVSELNAQEAGSTLIATMNAFNIEAEESIRIVDAFNEVDNNFAVSTQQIAEGMSRSASTARTFGVEMEEIIGHVTAISSVTQESGRIIGNSLKTIYSRITTMDSAEEVLNDVGVAIKQIGENGEEVRPVQDILEDLGAKWTTLTDEQRQNIAVTLAGRHQLSRFLALMNNWDTALEATGTALTSQGSAMRENAEYLKSFEARINQLKGTFTELSLSIGDAVLSDTLALLIDLLDSLANTAIKVVDNFGALPVAIGALGGILSAFGTFKKFNGDVLAGLGMLRGAFREAKGEATGFSGTMRGVGGQMSMMAHSVMPAFEKGLRGMVAGLRALGSATIYTAIFTAIGMGIEWIVGKFNEQREAQKELEESNRTLAESYSNYARAEETLEDLINKHDELKKAVNSGEIKEGTDAYNEYLQVNQELADALPTMVEYVDAKGVAHLKSAEAMRDEVDVAKELANSYRDDALAEFPSKLEGHAKSIGEVTDGIIDLNKEIQDIQQKINDGTEMWVDPYTGQVFEFEVNTEQAEADLRNLERQLQNSRQEMQGYLEDTLVLINETATASLDASGHLQNMSDAQVNALETFVRSKEEVLNQFLDAIAQSDDEVFIENTLESYKAYADTFKDQAEEMGQAISEAGQEALKGITDPRQYDEMRERIDTIFSRLPNNFIESVESGEDLKNKILEIVDATSSIGKEGVQDIDELAESIKGVFNGDAELAREFIIKLGLAFDDAGIRADVLEMEVDELGGAMEEMTEKAIDATEATAELFGISSSDISAIESRLQFMNDLIELQKDGTVAFLNNANEIAEFLGTTSDNVIENLDEFMEFIELLQDLNNLERDEETGLLTDESIKKYERVVELIGILKLEESDLGQAFEDATKEIERNTDAKEKNAEKTKDGADATEDSKNKTKEDTEAKKENKDATDKQAGAIETLTGKFNDFKESGSATDKAEWIQTLQRQLEELDGKIRVTKDEEFGGLKLEMADGTKSEWLNTVKSQLEELGIDLVVVEDDVEGTKQIMLSDGTGRTFFADATDDVFDLDEGIDTIAQKGRTLPEDFTQIDFRELITGIDDTTLAIDTISEALKEVWDNVTYLQNIELIVGYLQEQFEKLKDAIQSVFDDNTGDFQDLEQKAKNAKKAVDDVRTAIIKLNNKAREIPLDTFNGLKDSANEASNSVDSLKSSLSGVPKQLALATGTSALFASSISGITGSTMLATGAITAYVGSLTTLTGILTVVTSMNQILSSSQQTFATAMQHVINVVNIYNATIVNANNNIASSHMQLTVTIARETAKIISEYNNHGNAVKGLERVADQAWRDIIRTTITRGQTLIDAVRKISNLMKDAFESGMESIVQVASEVPSEIGRSIEKNMSSASSSMDKVAKDMVRRFKEELGIHSPSRVFEQLGGDIIAGLANGLSGSDLKNLGKEVFSDFGGGIFDSWDMIKAYVSEDWSGFMGSGGAGVERWRGVAMQALAMTGQLNQANLERLLFQMRTESGGNPKAINLWDINAKRGIPSKGLMQVIDPTFNAYKMPGFNNIWNPLDNILASIRYTLARYGSLLRGWRGVGYETGGIIDEEHLALVGEGGKREAIIPLEQHRDRAVELWSHAGEELGLFPKRRRGYGGFGATIGGGFGALSGEGGSAEGGGGSGTSGIVQPSIYEGGANLDGDFQFMALNRESLYTYNKNDRTAGAYSHAITMIETRMRDMTENTLKYRNALKQVIFESQKLASIEKKELNRVKNRQKSIEKQIKSLGQTGKHTEKQRKKYNELQREYEQNISKIQSLEKSIEETNQKIRNTTTEIFIDWVDQIVGRYDTALEAIANKVDDLDFELEVLNLTDPDNTAEELKLLARRTREFGKQEATVRNMVNHLQKEYDKAVKKYGKSSKEATKVQEELNGAKESLEDAVIELLRAEKQIEDVRGGVADRGISQLKDYYGNMRDMAREAIEFEKRELEKAHKAKMDMYDKEIDKINSVYDERLKAMDAEKEEAEYQEELEEKNARRAELVNKISLLSRDTSVEGRKRVSELRAELSELDKEIAQYMRERQDKLLREAMEEQKQQEIARVEAEKEAEEQEYNTRVEELDKEANDISKYYDDMLNDEKYWADMREGYIKNSNETLIRELEDMSNQLAKITQGNFDDLTMGFSGFSDELKREFADLFAVDINNMNFNNDGVADMIDEILDIRYNPYSGDGSKYSNPSQTTWKGKSEAEIYEAKAPTAPKKKASSNKNPKVGSKVKVSTSNAKAYLDSYGRRVLPWADQAKAAGVKYGQSLYLVNSRNGYGALSKTNNIRGAIAWVKMDDLVGLRSGGYTGDWAGQDGKVAMLHKKELVLNERQTSDILDTAKIIDKVKDIIPSVKRGSVADKLATAGNITNIAYGDINVTVENGDRKKAKDIAKEIITGIKKRGK